jgi:hypothetical protein
MCFGVSARDQSNLGSRGVAESERVHYKGVLEGTPASRPHAKAVLSRSLCVGWGFGCGEAE